MSLFSEKTYVKSLSAVDGGTLSVQLRDTSGEYIPCTHILVKGSCDNVAFGSFWICPEQGQGGYLDVSSGNVQLINSQPSGKGSAGSAGRNDGEAELNLTPENAITQLKIVNNLGEPAFFIVQYGNKRSEGNLSKGRLGDGS